MIEVPGDSIVSIGNNRVKVKSAGIINFIIGVLVDLTVQGFLTLSSRTGGDSLKLGQEESQETSTNIEHYLQEIFELLQVPQESNTLDELTQNDFDE